MGVLEIIALFGIPSAITGLAIWWIKKRIEKSEKKAQEQQNNIESLILMIVQSSKANQIGIEAIARAVQRIPDAQCNGDMKAALEQMQEIQAKEKQFLIERGIKYLFE